MSLVFDALSELLKEVCEREILPRHRHLAETDVISKATATDPDDLVTVADRAAEAFLTERLPKLVSGSIVVGEEAAAANPAVLDALGGERPVWVVDPIDGTRNFASGVGQFGVMVALVERGVTLLSAIYLPLLDELYLAERGAGATRNGAHFQASAQANSKPGGTLYPRLMPAELKAALNARPESLELLPSPQCAAFEYPSIARGERDFALYYRLHPWDHLPGVLLVREAGGVARHPFESHTPEYDARDRRPLLLVAAGDERWAEVRRALFPHMPSE